MTGINILAEYTTSGVPPVLVAIGLLLAFVGLVLMLCGVRVECEGAAIAGVVFILASLLLAVTLEVFCEAKHTQYKVTISEDVNLVEFLERYEILDTEGEIYTVREVTPDA